MSLGCAVTWCLALVMRESWRSRPVRSSAVHSSWRQMWLMGHRLGQERPDTKMKTTITAALALLLLAGSASAAMAQEHGGRHGGRGDGGSADGGGRQGGAQN